MLLKLTILCYNLVVIGDTMKKKMLMISSIFIIIDQLIKLVIRASIILEKEIFIIPKFFYITNVNNTGGAFSILSDNTYLLILVGIIAILFIYYFLKNKTLSRIEEVSYSLLIGGIIGNLIDRIIFNNVTDYIGLVFGSYYYPVFNLADIGIVVSIIILIILEFRGEKDGIRSN